MRPKELTCSKITPWRPGLDFKLGTRASLLGARTLLVAPGNTTSNKKQFVARSYQVKASRSGFDIVVFLSTWCRSLRYTRLVVTLDDPTG